MNMCQIDFTLVFIMIPFIDVRLWLLLWDYHKERMWLERKRCWRLELFFSTPFNLSPTEIRKNPFINWTPIALRYKTREKTEWRGTVKQISDFFSFTKWSNIFEQNWVRVKSILRNKSLKLVLVLKNIFGIIMAIIHFENISRIIFFSIKLLKK